MAETLEHWKSSLTSGGANLNASVGDDHGPELRISIRNKSKAFSNMKPISHRGGVDTTIL
jgi:hypothetical protein